MQKPRIRHTADGHAMFADSFTNLATGIGTPDDKRTYGQFRYSPLDWYNTMELEAAYSTNWIARAIVDAPVDDATREWRSFSCKEASDIQRAEKSYAVQQHVQEAFKWAGLYGGCGIVLITNQPLNRPLDVDRIGKGDLKRLLVLDRRYLTGIDLNVTDPTSANFLMPENYMIAGSGSIVHHSHVIRIPGAKLPLSMRQLNGGWDDSQLRKCMEDVKDAVSAKTGIAAMIQEANVDIITATGLADALAAEDTAQLVMNRYRNFRLMKSNTHMGVLDESETYDRKGASFGGLGEVLSTLMEWVSGAAQIPMTRLFGVQSKGLGDSGEGDMKNYHNSIRSRQESDYRQVLERIDEVMLRSALGYVPDDCEFEWNPLSQPTDVELAQQALAFAQCDDIRLQQQVVKRSQVMRRLQADGQYGITDEEIEAMVQAENAEDLGAFDLPEDEADENTDPA